MAGLSEEEVTVHAVRRDSVLLWNSCVTWLRLCLVSIGAMGAGRPDRAELRCFILYVMNVMAMDNDRFA